MAAGDSNKRGSDMLLYCILPRKNYICWSKAFIHFNFVLIMRSYIFSFMCSAWREPNQNTLKRLFYYAYAFLCDTKHSSNNNKGNKNKRSICNTLDTKISSRSNDLFVWKLSVLSIECRQSRSVYHKFQDTLVVRLIT